MSATESSEDERPSFSGAGLGANRMKFVRTSFNDREASPAKRIRVSKPAKVDKKDDVPAYSKVGSFASRMMAQMGYREGEGLGKEGKGRLAPIQTQLRPQGVGLGAVKEKTKQAKQEEKREAAFRGEIIEDSEEEAKEKRKRQQIRRPGTKTTGNFQQHKVKYRTAREIEKESGGLEVPDVLKTLIDVTGNKTELLLTNTISVDDNEELKIARRARRDLEAYAEDWRALQERKRYYDDEFQRHLGEMDHIQERANNLQKLLVEVEHLNGLNAKGAELDMIAETIQLFEVRLHISGEGKVEETLKDASVDIQELTVAIISPPFARIMAEWNPLKTENPHKVIESLAGLKEHLGLLENLKLVDADTVPTLRKRKSGSYYDAMINTHWLPVVRDSIISKWRVEDPEPMTRIVEAWKDLLPIFIYSIVMNQLIIPRLTETVKKWRQGSKKHGEQGFVRCKPDAFLFPWLPLLPAEHLNPQGASSLLADVRRKLAQEIRKYDVQWGPPDWTTPWGHVNAFKSTLVVLHTNHLVPRLAQHMNDIDYGPTFERRTQIDNVQNTPLRSLSEWHRILGDTTISHLLSAHFFPPLMKAMYRWLITQPDVREIGNYIRFWQRLMDDKLQGLPVVHADWTKLISMVKEAFDLGDRVAEDLPMPEDKPIDLGRSQDNNLADQPGVADNEDLLDEPVEQTFKDIVEGWCEEYDLILVPLHSAHSTTGQPLYRITASASGKGGIQVYLKGDVVWAQDPKERGKFGPIELGDQLATWGGALSAR